jgi:predicted YcjX-like family ATPase
VSEIRLALRFRSNESLMRHFKDTSTLYLEIVDYPGEWLLDLPMLAQDYLSWSRQMTGCCRGNAPGGRPNGDSCAKAWIRLHQRMKTVWRPLPTPGRRISSVQTGRVALHSAGALCLPGDLAGAPALQFFPGRMWMGWASRSWRRPDKHTNAGMLRERYNYYCEKVVKGFYKNHFLRFDRQIVLVDCLQPLNSGPQAFNDMRLALTQLMQSFHYGQRTLFRRLFSPVIDKLLFAATKADHVTVDQHANMVSLLQQLVQDAWQNAAFEGIGMDCLGLASVQATQSGLIDLNGEKIPALRGNRLSDGEPLTVYPGEVPARLPGQAFWQNQGFQFEAFRPQAMSVDRPLPHIRLDAALEFLIGDKLR